MTFKYKKPKVVQKEIKNGQLILTLDWFGTEQSKVVITRLSTGYLYENVGFMWRSLSDSEQILEEIEFSKKLKEMIDHLPVVEEEVSKLPLFSKNGFKRKEDGENK